MKSIVLGALSAACLATLMVQAGERPVELGRVDWLRDFDVALKRSKETTKPILLVFQEVPG